MATRGRQPKCTPDRIAIICEAIKRGETNEVAAKKAGINIATFYDWQKNKSDFSEAIKRAKAEFDEWRMKGILEDAKASLKDLIKGFKQVTKKTRSYINKEGKTVIEETTEEKICPPNATAIIFALCNRDPEHWQNRVAQDVNGKIDVEQKGQGVSLANVPDSLLAQVIDAINGK